MSSKKLKQIRSEHKTILGQAGLKEQAYEKFRKFSKDTNRNGKTLASSSEIKFAATKSLVARRTFLFRRAFQPEYKVLAMSLMVPPEIAWAAGYIPFNLEMFSSLLASHSQIMGLSDKGGLTTPRCSFLNALIGGQKEGILPPPDLIVSSTAYCEAVSYTLEELSVSYKVEHKHIDLPHYTNEITIEAVYDNIEEIFTKAYLKNNISERDAEKSLKQVMYNSFMARKEHMELWDIMKKRAPLNLGLEPLNWHSQFLPMWGDERLPEINRKLKEDVLSLIQKGELKESGIPLAIYGLIPYGRTDLWEQMNDYNAYISFAGVNYIGDYQIPDMNAYHKLSHKELLRSIATNLLNTPMRGGNIIEKTDRFVHEMKELGSEGMVLFSQEHCQLLVPRIQIAEQTATKYGINSVTLGGDCILGMPKGPTTLRLGTFLSNLQSKSSKDVLLSNRADKEFQNIPKGKKIKFNNKNLIKLGVDFGNGFSKYLMLNNENEIVKQGLFSSGIDYPSLLKEISAFIPKGIEYNLAVSGVGSDNPKFKNLANNLTTEINALITATKVLFPKKKNFLVIDVGTQDVKVLKVKDYDSNIWINTNKSCGAGTGMVLVQILERWRHTIPGISFDKLDDMAYKAEKAELVNTTCGIFAITNVVSALVQSEVNSDRQNEILRGIYDYIASQAIRLLPFEDRNGGEIFLTGGIAKHKTLQKIFTEKGYRLISVPDYFHPQYLVAYGTALSLIDI